MNMPSLLDLNNLPLDAEQLRATALWLLGDAVETLLALPPGGLSNLRDQAQEGIPAGLDEWRAAIAREVLLVAATDPRRARALAQQLGNDVQPFGDELTLEALLEDGVETAGAVFPLWDRASDDGKAAQLWVLKGVDTGGPAPQILIDGDATGWMQRNQARLGVLLPRAERQATGESWQLAAEMACAALDQPGQRVRLARKWVLTGRVLRDDPGRPIRYVELGNKTSLAKLFPPRDWLFPAAVQADLSQDSLVDFRHLPTDRRCFALDAASAWEMVTGQGLLAGETVTWEELRKRGFATIHAFVSHALAPLLFSFLHLQPRRIVLWASPDMETRGRKLKDACHKLKEGGLLLCDNDSPELLDCPYFPVDVERTLRSHPTLRPGSQEPVVFNSTTGTYAMRVAPRELARLQGNMVVVYRPEKETMPTGMDEHEVLGFMALSYPGLQLTQAWLHLSNQVPEGGISAWDRLLNDRLERNPSECRSGQPEPLPDNLLVRRLLALAEAALRPDEARAWADSRRPANAPSLTGLATDEHAATE